MANITTIQNSIIQVLYTFGSIYRTDLLKLLAPYSKAPERYIKKLIGIEICEFNESKKIISLTKEVLKSYSKTLNHKATTKLIDSHDFITAQALLWYLENQEVEAYQIEKRVNGTALQADLYIKLRNGFEIYFEADTGTERVVELRNKILNYDNLDESKTVVITVTQTELNYKNLIDLTDNKPMYKVYLDNNLNEVLGCISYGVIPSIISDNHTIQTNITLNNIIDNRPATLLTLDEIQKLITSI